MAGRPLALAPEPSSEDDYRALSAALEESPRGRAFLAEYVRRSRSAETDTVIAALDRLSAQMRADAMAIDALRGELQTLVSAIRHTRPKIDAGQPPGKVAMLGALVDLLERRIDTIVENNAVDVEPASEAPPAETPLAQAMRPLLSAVPPPVEPELTIPSPLAAELLAIPIAAEARALPVSSIAVMSEKVFYGAPAGAPKIDGKCKVENTVEAEAKPAAATPQPPTTDRLRLLAPILALSENERLALFS
jgi:hypothetical protein